MSLPKCETLKPSMRTVIKAMSILALATIVTLQITNANIWLFEQRQSSVTVSGLQSRSPTANLFKFALFRTVMQQPSLFLLTYIEHRLVLCTAVQLFSTATVATLYLCLWAYSAMLPLYAGVIRGGLWVLESQIQAYIYIRDGIVVQCIRYSCTVTSVVCLSSVCNTCAPYSGGSNFRQYFYGIRYLGIH